MAIRTGRKALLIVAIVVIVAGVMVGASLSSSCSGPVDTTLPIIAWNETVLSTLQGTPVVLNFWSRGCYWCRRQLPHLENVAQQGGEALRVVAINIADDAAAIRRFFGDYTPAMMIAMDTHRETFAVYCLAYNNTRGAIPFTLFIDSQGQIRYTKLGAFASEKELRDKLHDVFGMTIP